MKVKCKFIDVGRAKKSWTDEISVHDGVVSEQDLIRSIKRQAALGSRDIQFNRDFTRDSTETAAWDIWVGGFRIVGRVMVVHEPLPY